MSSSTFRELLSKPTDAVERPRALAAGHYVGEIKNFEFGTSRQKQTPYVRFMLTPIEATTDVADNANGDIDLSKKELRKDFYITPTALYRLSDMLDATLGKQQGRSFDERIPETRGARVMFAVSTRESDDGNETYNDVGLILAAE
jgi:hypothetical protein